LILEYIKYAIIFKLANILIHLQFHLRQDVQNQIKNYFFKSLDKVESVPLESIHIGDNYQLDYIPSNEIGMRSLLIDRDGIKNYNFNINTISTLESITEHLNEY